MTQQYPQKSGIETIVKNAFSYWSKTLIYQILFSLVYLSIFLSIAIYAMNHYGIIDDYMALGEKLQVSQDAYLQGAQELAKKPEFQTFYFIMLGTMMFLYPLNMGFYKIYRKIDLGEKYDISDLFAGYRGINFFIYTSYYLFWMVVFSYTMQTIFLGIVWVFITLFSAPLMFFMNKTIFQSISLNFKALKSHFLEIFVCFLVAVIFKYIGVISIVGLVFTFPFVNAMIYALYRNIFNEDRKKEKVKSL